MTLKKECPKCKSTNIQQDLIYMTDGSMVYHCEDCKHAWKEYK